MLSPVVGDGACRRPEAPQHKEALQSLCKPSIRKQRGLGQTDLVRMLQISGCDMTRECLVKIERCVQHIQGGQLRAIRDALNTTYEALLDGTAEE